MIKARRITRARPVVRAHRITLTRPMIRARRIIQTRLLIRARQITQTLPVIRACRITHTRLMPTLRHLLSAAASSAGGWQDPGTAEAGKRRLRPLLGPPCLQQ